MLHTDLCTQPIRLRVPSVSSCVCASACVRAYVVIKNMDFKKMFLVISVYLYFSPNNIRIIKLRRTRWVGHVARKERRQMCTKFLVRKPELKKSRPFRLSVRDVESQTNVSPNFMKFGIELLYKQLSSELSYDRPIDSHTNVSASSNL